MDNYYCILKLNLEVNLVTGKYLPIFKVMENREEVFSVSDYFNEDKEILLPICFNSATFITFECSYFLTTELEEKKFTDKILNEINLLLDLWQSIAETKFVNIDKTFDLTFTNDLVPNVITPSMQQQVGRMYRKGSYIKPTKSNMFTVTSNSVSSPKWPTSLGSSLSYPGGSIKVGNQNLGNVKSFKFPKTRKSSGTVKQNISKGQLGKSHRPILVNTPQQMVDIFGNPNQQVFNSVVDKRVKV